MPTRFSIVALDLIDEGEFLKRINADFRELQAQMVEFTQTHGEQAAKAKGKLIIEISLIVDAPKDLAFTIKGTTKRQVPTSPPNYSIAMGETGDDEKPALFVRGSGSSREHPRQGKMHTNDGRKIDTDTGEVEG